MALILKGLVLAGGEGQRLRPFTLSRPKHLIPLLGKPIIEYPIEQFLEVGIRNICIVVGYMRHMIKENLDNRLKGSGVVLSYVTQEKRLGIAHAINVAIESGAIDSPFIAYLGDNIVAHGIGKYVTRFSEEEPDVLILLSRVKNPFRFGVAIIKNGKVIKLIEKPKEKVSDLAVIGVYFFRDPDLVSKAFMSLKPSKRGEYEITDLINWFIRNGYTVAYEIITGWWKDVGTSESLLEALYLLLDHLKGPIIEGDVKGEVIGKVIAEQGSVIEGTVYGPAYIGRGVFVAKEALIEHYVSVEKDARIASGSVTRSVIFEHALVDIGRLRMTDSIVGAHTLVRSRQSAAYNNIKLVLSDYSRVEL